MNILITAGGNTEKIDDVRAIRNTGTGQLGALIAEKLALASAVDRVFYICDRRAVKPFERKSFREFQERYGQYDDIGILSEAYDRISVSYADDVISLRDEVTRVCSAQRIDAVVHSMAVSDYRVKNVTTVAHAGERVSETLYKTLYNEAYTGNGGKGHCDDTGRSDDTGRNSNTGRSNDTERNGNTGHSDDPGSNFRSLLKETAHSRIPPLLQDAAASAIASAPSVREGGKISSDLDDVLVVLERAPKVISLYRGLAPGAIIVGFKLLSGVDEEELIRVGHALLKKNDCNYVLANDAKYFSAGEHIGHLIGRGGSYRTYDGKDAIADAIAAAVKTAQDA
jgi:phosphopantothenate-cysteine ligase